MRRVGKIPGWLLLLTVAVALPAQSPPEPPPPPLPPLKSPVDQFRELLALSPREREAALVHRPAAQREGILAKLREYQTLNANEREARLLATELRWWLLPLMRLPVTNRPAQLSLVPARLRQLVEDRLQVWDILPPDLQQAQLDNEDMAQLFLRLQGRAVAPGDTNLSGLQLSPRQQESFARWSAMSPAERHLVCQQFDRYFELTPREQGRVLNQLSDTEREQMQQTLDTYAHLPREQRLICLRSFEKFAGMTAAERQQFLKNAERWEKMSPAERETWRKLVKHVPDLPLLPPDFDAARPPLPPGLPSPAPVPVTNRGG
jgi:hypothetical protein